jgi:hypothetical protein
MSEGFELSIVFAVISAIFVLSLHLVEKYQGEPATLTEELAGTIGLMLSSTVLFLLIHLTFNA